MADSLLAVEGAHDSSFFGALLRARGYRPVQYLSAVPDLWEPLIPRRFPTTDAGYLGRIVTFPDIYVNAAGDSVGILIADGQDRLVRELRSSLDQLGPGSFAGIGVVFDADYAVSLDERFDSVVHSLRNMSDAAVGAGVTGFPLDLPNAVGTASAGPPKVSIYLFPDNQRQGVLETSLLATMSVRQPGLGQAAAAAVAAVDQAYPPGDPLVQKLRSISGREKATAGIIANLLSPGSSLAVALRGQNWLGQPLMQHPDIVAADAFLASLL